MKVIGIILIVLGLAGVIYGGFSYTTHKNEVNMGPLRVQKSEQRSVPIPPILGIVAIAGGGLLVYSGSKADHRSAL
jgi:hypothetical protein